MVNIISAWFDGVPQIKRGDRVTVLRGIADSPTSIRITKMINNTTGQNITSDIDQTLMTKSAEDLEIPLMGRIGGNIDVRSNTTHFKIEEGTIIKRKEFTESTKRAELLDSKGKCRDCGKNLVPGNHDFDHKDGNPLNNKRENCYVRCKSCHGIKTHEEQKLKRKNYEN